MNARPLPVMLMATAIILPAITPVPTFADAEKPVWDVQELYKQCKYKGSLEKIFCLEFVSNAARQVFTNGVALRDLKRAPDPAKITIPSACPKSFVSNDAMVEAFSEWANEHLEKWNTSADAGVMQAMHDTWPCR
jgi:Rap1a immunity proteins